MDTEKEINPGHSVDAIHSPVVEACNPYTEPQPDDPVLPTWRLVFIAIR
jgi:hypothetical protein